MNEVYDSDNCEGYPKLRILMDKQFEKVKRNVVWFDSDSLIEMGNERNKLSKIVDKEEFLNETFYLNLHWIMSGMDVSSEVANKLIKGDQKLVNKKKNKQRVFAMISSFLLDKMGFNIRTPKQLRTFLRNHKLDLNSTFEPKITLEQWMDMWSYKINDHSEMYGDVISDGDLVDGYCFSETILTDSKNQSTKDTDRKIYFKNKFLETFGIDYEWNSLPICLRRKVGGLLSRWLDNPKYFIQNGFVDEFNSNSEWRSLSALTNKQIAKNVFEMNGGKVINRADNTVTLNNIDYLINYTKDERKGFNKVEWSVGVLKDLVDEINNTNKNDEILKQKIKEKKLSKKELHRIGVSEDKLRSLCV